MASIIRLTHSDITIIKDMLNEGRTIAAVKHCRTFGRHFVDGVETFATGSGRARMSLRAAKHAIDDFRGAAPPTGGPEAIIGPVVEIKSVKIATLEGEFEVDLDELQLRMLDGLDTLPLSVLSHSAELITYLRNWQNASVGK